jgi:hypothetical protein
VKRLFHSVLFAFSIILGFAAITNTGCKTSQQRISYNTLYSVQSVTVGAFDSYVAQVIKGNIPTNSLPQVSRKFNVFQAAFAVALDAVQYNTNALAPDNLMVISGDLINLINAATPKTK